MAAGSLAGDLVEQERPIQRGDESRARRRRRM
jgi:hypothetical protein